MAAKSGMLALAIGCLLALTVPALAQESAAGRVLAQLPADAYAVVTVRSIAELETGLKAVLGEDTPAPEMAKGIEKDFPAGVLDARGRLFLVVLKDAHKFRGVTLLPIKDESLLKGEALDGGIVKMKFAPAIPNLPAGVEAPSKTVYVLKMGAWAAFDADPESVKALAAAAEKMKVTDAQRDDVEKHLVWAHANVTSLSELLRTKIEAEKNKPIDVPAPAGAPVSPAMAMRIGEWAVRVLDQVPGADLVGDVQPTGITATFSVAMAGESQLLAAAQAGLPIENFQFGLPASDRLVGAAWMRVDWPRAVPPIKLLFRPLMDIFTEGADEATRKSLDDLMNSYEQFAAAMGSDAGMMFEPAPTGQGMFRMAETISLKDPAEYRKLMVQKMGAATGLVKTMMAKMGQAPGAPKPKMDMEYKEAAETVEGLPVDVMRMKMEMIPPADLPPDQAAKMKEVMDKTMTAMYGPEGMVMRIAVVDKRAVIVMGDGAAMAKAIKAARGQGPELAASPELAARLAKLPKGSSAAGVISATQFVYMMGSVAEQTMLQVLDPAVKQAAVDAGLKPLEPQTPAAPVLVSARLDGPVARIAIDVPVSDIRGVITASRQIGDRMKWYGDKQRELAPKAKPPAQGETVKPELAPKAAEK